MHREGRTDSMVSRGSRRITRRDAVRRSFYAGASMAAAGHLGVQAVSAAPAAAIASAMQDGVYGGRLRIAVNGEPPSLDAHQGTVTVVADITYPMYETLFTYDANYQPIPELVDTYTMSEDGLTHTMTLRQGITFHNGEPMTAADVHASVTRWAELSGVGKNLFEAVDEFVEVDDMTVEFRLGQPYSTILIALAHNTQACTIHPKSVLDETGTAPFSDDSHVVGTGPYMLDQRQADAFVRLKRFDGFVPRTEPTNGYGGAKYAFADEIEFMPVPDEAARVAGLQAGDYEIAQNISNDQYELLANSPGIVAEIGLPTEFEIFFLNWRSPLMSNLALREAFQAGLNHQEILTAARGGGDFTRLDPGWMLQQTQFHTTSGEEFYNINDPELAKQKLEEAGYDGTPLRWMTSQEYPSFYNASIIAQQQLEAVGFVIDMQVTDWATVLERRGQDTEWDVFCTRHVIVTDPSQLSFVGGIQTYPGWWDSEASVALVDNLLSEPDFDARYAIWEELQHNIYTEIPAIKVGDASLASYYSDRVGGWVQQIERGVPHWNLWLKDA